MQVNKEIEVWGGIEATLNRVRANYHDQLEYTGHYYRKDDIDTIATLGIKTLRYPVLWERHQPQKDTAIDWSFSEKNLLRLRELGIKPIVGLVHHGSGPKHVSFFDGSFEKGLASFASTVAEKFPWIEYYTPVNEPLTTARFCGLYGHWYPHTNDEHSFYTILLSECKATVKAMQAIRQVNPSAKLVQTEDLGKTYCTPLLQYQARFDNHRRWLTFDLLCGKVNEQHPLWNYLTTVAGMAPEALHYFLENNCPPDICGLNYYMTSERYLDEDMEKYPQQYHSGNGKHNYADIERIRIDTAESFGIKPLLKEAYKHLQLPIAITECHLHCTRDEQMRWFNQVWLIAKELKKEGVDVRAVTAWALFGTYGWDKLMVNDGGTYETGAFKVTTGFPKPTAFGRMLQTLSAGKVFHHPLIKRKGWWQRDMRLFYGNLGTDSTEENELTNGVQPLLIVGEKNILKEGFNHICFDRNIPIVFIEPDKCLTNRNVVDKLLKQHNPWAVIVHAHQENQDTVTMMKSAVCTLAAACKFRAVKLMCFVPDTTTEKTGTLLYESDYCHRALHIHNATISKLEEAILAINANALLIRTGNLASPWDENSFVSRLIEALQQDEVVEISACQYSSFAYVPDVVHLSLDWLLDGESGIYYMANSSRVDEIYIATKVAKMLDKNLALLRMTDPKIQPALQNIQLLPNDKRIKLPYLENALQRYIETVSQIKKIAEAVPA